MIINEERDIIVNEKHILFAAIDRYEGGLYYIKIYLDNGEEID